MNDFFKKIQSLANELEKNADAENGGGIIILASNPNAEKGEPNSVVFMKGRRMDLMAILAASFTSNKDLKEISIHSLFISSMVPESLIGKKEE